MNNTRLKLMLLYGGKSGEHEISLRSAASVMQQLDPERYQIIPVGMDKEGKCYVNDYKTLLSAVSNTEALPVTTASSRMLESLLVNGQLAIDADVVFPMVHGPLYEDGALQGLLDLANVAYVGCDVLSSAIGMDKDIARRLVKMHDIPSASYHVLSGHADAEQIEIFCSQVIKTLGWPMFVKPCSMGSSVGIQKVHDRDALIAAITDAARYDEEIVVESMLYGREIELAVLENIRPEAQPHVSLPGEICVNHPDGFYSYTAKYLESHYTTLVAPAQLEDAMTQRLQEASRVIFTALKCKGMARVDFFVDVEHNTFYFNEVNTLPGFTSISMYPKLWQLSGIPYSALLDQLIKLAMVHHRRRLNCVTHYQ